MTVRGKCVQTSVCKLAFVFVLLLYVCRGLHISALHTGKCYFSLGFTSRIYVSCLEDSFCTFFCMSVTV